MYDDGLGKNPANFAPQTPLTFVGRSAQVYPDKIAVIHGDQQFTYREFDERCRRLASALIARGVGKGDTVSVMAPNVPALLEAHYGVPMTGAVLNALNYRLDAATIAFILNHANTKVLITDTEFSAVIKEALPQVDHPMHVIDIDDPLGPGGEALGDCTYETWLQEEGDGAFQD